MKFIALLCAVPMLALGLVSLANAADKPEVVVTMGKPSEFTMGLSSKTVKAGEAVLNVRNRGKIMHEMALLRTAKRAKDLKPRPKEPNKVEEPGFMLELEDVEPGQGAKLVLPLRKGHYVLVCNIEGHAAGGMRADLDVK